MLDLNKVYNMDCIEGMKLLDDESIDLVVTSPPYDNLREYNNSSSWNFDIFKQVAEQLYRIIKPGGVIVWIVNDAITESGETGTSFRQALYFKDIGLRLHDTMIWSKDGFPFPHSNCYHQTFEYMFVMSKGKPITFNPIIDRRNKCVGSSMVGSTHRLADGSIKARGNLKEDTIQEYGKRYNVWEISAVKGNTGHPAPFPIQLVKDHIISWSNENDIVLDPFMGSGTTAIACLETYRQYIGFEIDKEYYKIIDNRLWEHTKQLRMI